MNTMVALSLGSNCGDRFFYIRTMEAMLLSVLLPPLKRSCVFETEPVEVYDVQPWYLNRIISGYFNGSANDLLNRCIEIEITLGRERKGDKTPRTADIDILLFGKNEIYSDVLIVPHPAIMQRRFCLEGLKQIMPDTVIATTGKTIKEHYQKMDCSVKKQKVRNYSDITGAR